MNNVEDGHLDFSDVEAMVRDAAGYIDVSRDLRPKTLELARQKRNKAHGRLWLELIVVGVTLLMTSTPSLTGHMPSAAPLRADLTADTQSLLRTAQQKSTENLDDVNWSLVEAFRELRQRQSRVIDEVF
jgi:hypothetical protein